MSGWSIVCQRVYYYYCDRTSKIVMELKKKKARWGGEGGRSMLDDA